MPVSLSCYLSFFEACSSVSSFSFTFHVVFCAIDKTATWPNLDRLVSSSR